MIPIARKVIRDAVRACQQSVPPSDVLHLAAVEELNALIQMQEWQEKNLGNLSGKQVDKLVDQILERDAAGAEISQDTKAYKIIDPENLLEANRMAGQAETGSSAQHK